MNKAERTRQFIIEKTAPIFNKKGYAGTSLTDMTDATGLTKGSIYGNFSDKDEVAVAAFEHNIQVLQAATAAEMGKQPTARGKLLAMIDAYYNIYRGGVMEGGCPIMNTTVDCDDTHPRLKMKAAEVMLGWKNRVTQLIEKGIAGKEFGATVNAEQTALTLIALIEGAILIRRATDKTGYYRQVLETARKVVNGL
ncbi:MAG TPA: TetR/AcrR family transcriptional regulator [Puia sp.]|jgi:AcrR family transcriptional regulator|nr:TetR/AcrR family transcriptional regulator [Puia sp.]